MKTRFNIAILMILLASCSTLKKSIIYPAIGGAIAGGLLGKELSPNKESDKYNMAIGSAIGATISGAVGYYLYNDANPTLNLKESTLKQEMDTSLAPLRDTNFSMDKFMITPKMELIGNKEYLEVAKDLPPNLKKGLKKQYFKRYKTEAYAFEQGNKTYMIPSFEIVESGVE